LTVSQGDEVFSIRNGTGVLTDIVRLEVSTIDSSGINFNYDIDRIATAQPETKNSIQHASLRMNFDGSKSGPWDFVSITEIWNFKVEIGDGTKATIRFESANPRLLTHVKPDTK
jgi:hypothetical protein